MTGAPDHRRDVTGLPAPGPPTGTRGAPDPTIQIALDGVTKRYETSSGAVLAVEAVSLAVHRQEFLTLLGPSGCGKSTVLAMIGGLVAPDAGRVEIEGAPCTGPDPKKVALVFQEAGLFPWRTALDNVGFGLELAGVPAARRREIARDLLGPMGLRGFEGKYPRELSGGMRQRVAIARALALDAPILLMDEPFGALDSQTRSLMQAELLGIWQRSPKTVIFVTHDVQEAVYLAGRVAVMSARPGHIKQIVDTNFDKNDPHLHKAKHFVDKVDELWTLVRAEAIAAQGTKTQ